MQSLEHIQRLDQKLGVGAHGVVYLGFDDLTGRLVAIKEVPYIGGDDAEGVARANQILQEMRVMKRFGQHENLVKYFGARRCRVGVQLVMEYVGGGSLERLLRLRGRLPEAVARSYARDVLLGLRCLHEELRVCHRDIKPGNILLTPEGRCKLTDFGVSKMLNLPTRLHEDSPSKSTGGDAEDPFMQTTVGTPWYMAPEVISGGGGSSDSDEDGDDGEEPVAATHYYNPLKGISFRPEGDGDGDGGGGGPPAVRMSQYERTLRAKGYTTSADIWSLGVTVYELVSGERPFGGNLENPTAVLFSIINSAAQPPKLPEEVRRSVSPELRGFLSLCFVYDKALRPSAAELLAHPWLTRADGGPPPTAAGTAAAGSISRGSSAAAARGAGPGSSSGCGSPRPTPPQPPRVHSPMFDAVDLLPLPAAASSSTTGAPLPLPPSRHISSSGRSLCRAVERTPKLTATAASHADPPCRRLSESSQQSSQPHHSDGASSTATPLHVRAAKATGGGGGGGRATAATMGGGVRLRAGRGEPQTATTAAPRATVAGGEGFFSMDGHYVDFLTSIPPPRE